MTKPNKIYVGFDLDGVIIDHTSNKVRLAGQLGWDLKAEQTHSEIIEKIIPQPMLRKLQLVLYEDPTISLQSQPMTGVKIAIDQIVHAFPYVLISRRKNSQSAINLMRYHGLWPKYFNVENVHFVSTPEDKNKKAVELGLTHYIDDEAGVLDRLVSVKNRFLFDIYNQFPDSKNYKRINSWTEFNKILGI